MTEQTYKEATAAIKESGIALDLQKEILSSIDRDFNKNNEWIPCSERLPNEDDMKQAYRRNKYAGEFIVMIEGASAPTTLYRTWDGRWVDDYREIYNVLAWQQLPEPYKTEGKIINIF